MNLQESACLYNTDFSVLQTGITLEIRKGKKCCCFFCPEGFTQVDEDKGLNLTFASRHVFDSSFNKMGIGLSYAKDFRKEAAEEPEQIRAE